MEIKYSRNCAEISIFSFDKVSKTNNFLYMIRDWDEYEKLEIDLEIAQNYWKDIFNEYVILNDDNKSLMYYTVLSQLSYLRTRKEVVTKLLHQITSQKLDNEMFDRFIDALSRWKYILDRKVPQSKAIEKLYQQLRASDNKIRLKENELGKFKMDGDEMSLTTQVVKLEKALGKNLIDPKKTSAEKWAALMNELKTKSA